MSTPTHSDINVALNSRDVPDSTDGSRRRRNRSPIRFFKNVYAELRKVVWPTRKEVIKYSIVVLFTLILMLVIIVLLDNAFGAGALFLFK